MHHGIFRILRCPAFPVMKIIDEREDLLGRSLNRNRAFHPIVPALVAAKSSTATTMTSKTPMIFKVIVLPLLKRGPFAADTTVTSERYRIHSMVRLSHAESRDMQEGCSNRPDAESNLLVLKQHSYMRRHRSIRRRESAWIQRPRYEGGATCG